MVSDKERTRDRREAEWWSVNTAARSEDGQGEWELSPRPQGARSEDQDTGDFFQVIVRSPWKPHPAQKHQTVPLAAQWRGLGNVSLPNTPCLHALPEVYWMMTDGMRPGQDAGARDKKETSQFSKPNSSRPGYGKSMSLLPGSRSSEHLRASDSHNFLFLLEPLFFFFSHGYIITKSCPIPERPDTRSLASVTYQSALRLLIS